MKLGLARRMVDDVVAPLAAILLALVAGAVLILLAGQNPIAIYVELFGETLGTAYGIGQVVAKATPLIFAGLGVAVGFRTGMFNIGAEGQMMIGGLFAALAGLAYPTAPAWLLVPLALAGAAAGGAAAAGIPAWLRSARGVHEVISTLMFNFIAAAIVGAAMSKIAVEATVHSETLPDAARLPRLAAVAEWVGLHSLAIALRPSPASSAFLLALIAAVVVRFVMWRTVGGFEMRAVGLNPAASATAGIPVGATMRNSFYLSGALAGLASVGFVLGNKYYYETGFSDQAGFTAIAVALLGRNHPAGVVLAALLFGTLSQGGLVVNGKIPREIVDVLQALVILFLICGMTGMRMWVRAREGRRGARPSASPAAAPR